MATIAVGATLWWGLPCELRLDVRVPQGTDSHYLGALVGRHTTAGGPYEILQSWMLEFPDGVAHDTTFRARLPHGEYRIVVECENAARFDETIRLGVSRTLIVRLTSGNPIVRIP